MVTRVGIAGGPATEPDTDRRTGVDTDDDPDAPVQVVVIAGERRISPVWVDDDNDFPPGTPGSLMRTSDGRLVLVDAAAADAAARRYTHVQSAPQTVWTFEHGKGRPPIAWVLRDTDGTECWGYTVQNLDADTVRVSMEDPTAGSIAMIF